MNNNSMTKEQSEVLLKRATTASVGVAVTLIGLKTWGYIDSGSVAIFGTLLDRVKSFINDEVKPKEHVFHDQIKEGEDRWNQYPAVIDELKDKAKSAGLWNLF